MIFRLNLIMFTRNDFSMKFYENDAMEALAEILLPLQNFREEDFAALWPLVLGVLLVEEFFWL